jgi:hypothetical protein
MLEDRLEAFRAGRRELERSVLPLATSVDGRRFTFQASAHELELQVGGYVALETDGPQRLGQILALELGTFEAAALEGGPMQIRHVRGEGAVLDGGDRPFHDATVRRRRVKTCGRGWSGRRSRGRGCGSAR